ncbi:hypothetical protein ACU4GR_04245 [Methylobacterium oryzae CBMB20]
MPRLKRAQYWILDALLAHAPVHAAAHGFVPGRSIVTNAAAHVGRDVVVNLDLKDFFPSLDYRRIKGSSGAWATPSRWRPCWRCSAPSRTWTRSRSTAPACTPPGGPAGCRRARRRVPRSPTSSAPGSTPGSPASPAASASPTRATPTT